jgi:hypothetical protein
MANSDEESRKAEKCLELAELALAAGKIEIAEGLRYWAEEILAGVK